MKDAITKTYGAKGEKVLSMNYAAVDEGVSAMHEITVPESWAQLPTSLRRRWAVSRSSSPRL